MATEKTKMKNFLDKLLGVVMALSVGTVLADDMGQQTRIGWLDSCPSSPKPVKDAQANRSGLVGALVTAIGAKFISGAVDSAANALKAAGETKTVSTTARSTADFYGITVAADLMVRGTCLVVIRGVFDKENLSFDPWAENYDEFRGLQSTSFWLEAKVQPLRGLKYFQLVPQYLKVDEFQESGWFGPKDRDFIVALTLTVPGGAQPFGSAEMNFKDVARGTKWKDEDWPMRAAASLPIAFPAESLDATKAKTKREADLAPFLLAQDILEPPAAKPFNQAPDLYEDSTVQNSVKRLCDAIDLENKRLNNDHELTDDRCHYRVTQAKAAIDTTLETAHRNAARQAWAKGVCQLDSTRLASGTIATKCINEPAPKDTAGKSFTYFTTQMTLSETREGSKFAKFLGNALGAANPDVSSALQAELLPKSQAIKDSEEAATRTARTAILVADLEVTKAEEGLADALMQDPPKSVDITSARIVLLKAKIATNDAYRKANLPVPYPELG
jgi:hypothetical protein